MRIVVVSPALPLPFGRADARWLHVMLPELARRGHAVTCLSCTEESAEQIEEARQYAGLGSFAFRHVPFQTAEGAPVRKLRSLLRPFSEYLRCDGLREALDQVRNAGYDILHVEHLFTRWAALGRSRAVSYLHHLEVVDWAARRDLSVRERITLTQMRRATRTLLGSEQPVIVASERLAQEAGPYRARPLPVAPVALDPHMYPAVQTTDDPVVGIVGSMHWYPSRSAAERVLTRLWPRIRERVPNARLIVAGWNSERVLGRYFPLEGATLQGEFGHPEEFFSGIGVLLYPPARGSGCKIKVMEAMAYGIPVVSNVEGLEGLHMPPALRERMESETDEGLVERTVTLLEDPTIRRRVSEEGRRLILEEYSPGPAVDRLLAAYQAVGLAA